MATPCIILNFHGIGSPWADLPEDEKTYWISATFFEEILDHCAPRIAAGENIVFTFDDGNMSDVEIALPALIARGLTAQFFVLTGRVGDPRYLDAKNMRTIRDAGMAIGLHGRDHIDWRRADEATLQAETQEARRILEALIDAPVPEVGIPFGGYNRRVISTLKRIGFRAIYTSDGGPAHSASKVRARSSVRSDMTLDGIARIVNNQYSLNQRLRRLISTTLRQYIL